MDPTLPARFRALEVNEATERFALDSGDIYCPYYDYAEDQEIRVHDGDLHLVGDLTNPEGCQSPYNLIVDGNLTIEGNLAWWDETGSFVLVTGSLVARGVLLGRCANLVVRGDLTASCGVLGMNGEDGGYLVVGGRTRAPLVFSDGYFGLQLYGLIDAVVVADQGSRERSRGRVDFTQDQAAGIIQPHLLTDDGEADVEEIRDAIGSGEPVLRTDVMSTRTGPPR